MYEEIECKALSRAEFVGVCPFICEQHRFSSLAPVSPFPNKRHEHRREYRTRNEKAIRMMMMMMILKCADFFPLHCFIRFVCLRLILMTIIFFSQARGHCVETGSCLRLLFAGEQLCAVHAEMNCPSKHDCTAVARLPSFESCVIYLLVQAGRFLFFFSK